MKKVLFVVSLLLLSGCAGVVGEPSPVHEVGEVDMVKDCRLLGSIEGPSSYRMWGTPFMGNFKSEALAKAEKMGATHVWFTTVNDSIGSTAVVKAYTCPANYDATKNNEDE
jgi:hypothetical protein